MAAVKSPEDTALRNSSNASFVNDVVYKNVELTIENMKNDSPLLRDMENDGDITIIGAVYDVASGAVSFLNS